MTTPDIDLDALEAAALAATQLPWSKMGKITSAIPAGFFEYTVAATDEEGDFPIMAIFEESDAMFVGAANPAVVLELIRRLRAAEGATK